MLIKISDDSYVVECDKCHQQTYSCPTSHLAYEVAYDNGWVKTGDEIICKKCNVEDTDG